MKIINVLIADDHELMREGIKSCIERQPGWRVCATVTDGRQAVALALQHQPDVAVLDIGMPELNGLDAARQIRQACPRTEVLILTMQESDDLLRGALAAGARGFLLKTDAALLLTPAIQALLEKKTFFTNRVSDLILAGFLDSHEAASGGAARRRQLTMREREIVQLLAEAHTSKVIATRLGVSVKTIEAHRANVMRKLNLHSIAELVRYAVRNQIINP